MNRGSGVGSAAFAACCSFLELRFSLRRLQSCGDFRDLTGNCAAAKIGHNCMLKREFVRLDFGTGFDCLQNFRGSGKADGYRELFRSFVQRFRCWQFGIPFGRLIFAGPGWLWRDEPANGPGNFNEIVFNPDNPPILEFGKWLGENEIGGILFTHEAYDAEVLG